MKDLDKCTITFSTNSGHAPATISGNLFTQLSKSYAEPKHPCRNCGGLRFVKSQNLYWVCTKCGQLSGWRKGDDKRGEPCQK